MKHDRNRIHPHLYLKVVYDNSISGLCVPIRIWKRSGVYGKQKEQFYISYVMRTVRQVYNTEPLYVRYTEDAFCKQGLSDEIPIYRCGKKVKFGLCLHQPMYNVEKSQEVVDWIVIHQLMGVEIIYIYLEMRYLSKEIPNAIQPFVNSGLVELIDWSIGVETNDYGQFGVIQDCLYRSIATVEYLALYDLDEILVPHHHYTWFEMLQKLEVDINTSNYASLLFENHIWYNGGKKLLIDEADMEICSNMKVPVYLSRTQRALTATKITPPKIIIRPMVVDSCWVHYALDIKPGLLLQYTVPMTIGSIHHYRKDKSKIIASVFDPTMQRYAKNSMEVIKKLRCS